MANGNYLVEMTAQIVSAYVEHNQLTPSNIPEMIDGVSEALRQIEVRASEGVKEELVPAVAIKKSITDEYIICLEDGKQFKALKRHLRSKFGLSPEEYREKWGLPYDYPMVAPGYAARRSALAKKMGLGKKRKK